MDIRQFTSFIMAPAFITSYSELGVKIAMSIECNIHPVHKVKLLPSLRWKCDNYMGF